MALYTPNPALTTGALDETIRAYYDRLALVTLSNNVVFYQFAVKKPLPGKSGATVFWVRYNNFTEITTHLTEGATPTPIPLSAVGVSATVIQDGAVTELSDLTDMTNITDNGKAAVARLAELAGRSIDSFFRREVYNTSTNSAPPTAPNAIALFGKRSDLTSQAVSAMLATSSGMSVSTLRYVTTYMRSLNAKPISGNDFVLVCHPYTAAKLRADSVWQNANQYSGSFAEKIFAGEVGRIEGIRVVESTNIPMYTSGGTYNAVGATISTADCSVFYSVLLADQGLGTTELGGGLETYVVNGADKADPLNQWTTYGWKISWVPKVLNISCVAVIATMDML